MGEVRERLCAALPATKASEVTVTVIRQGERLNLPVVLGSLNGPLPGENANRDILDGLLLEVPDEEMRRKWSVPEGLNGVIIRDVAAGSPYGNIMTSGMMILEVNGRMVTEPADVAEQLRPGANRFYVWRQGTSYYVVIYIQG